MVELWSSKSSMQVQVLLLLIYCFFYMFGNISSILKIFFKKCSSLTFFISVIVAFFKNLVTLPIAILTSLFQETYYGLLFLKESLYKSLLAFSNVRRVVFFLKKYQNTKKYSIYIHFYTHYINNFNLPLVVLEFFLKKKYQNIATYSKSFKMYYRFNHNTNVLSVLEQTQTRAETFLTGLIHM